MSAVLGIVCGIEAEARTLGSWANDARVAVAVSGGRPERAAAETQRLAGEGVRAVLSWGIAGGLDPALVTGALVVPDGVIVAGGPPTAFETALVAACRGALAGTPYLYAGEYPRRAEDIAAGPQPPAAAGAGLGDSPRSGAVRVSAGPSGQRGLAGALLLAGSDSVLLTSAAKSALRSRTGALAVDMESHRVAASARRARLPVAALRAVSDAAGRRLPALVAHALDAAGRPRRAAVLAGIIRRPWDLPALIAARRDSRAALAALAAAAPQIIPALLDR